MGIKMILKVISKSGNKMHRDMGRRATSNIDSVMCMKMRKKDG